MFNNQPCVWWLRSIYTKNSVGLGYVYFKGGINYSLCMTGNGLAIICLI